MRRILVAAAGALALALGALAAPAGAVVFSGGPITIPVQGNGNPYPSQIVVGNLTGAVTNVTVTINGFSHTFPSDVRMLLVGPSGQTVNLMSGVGGGTDVTNATLVFSQAAPGTVPTPIVSGTYRPTPTIAFNGGPPAPAGPYGASLAIFNGTIPNGTWRLFVFDGANLDSGSIAGWSLDITTNGPAIGSFAPTTGAAGTQVVITGTNLAGATGVSFGGTAATQFTVVSPTQITATVPPGAQSGPITVTTPNGTATSGTPFQTTPAPTITALSPASGRVGTQVTITGTNLTGATQVSFNGIPATGVAVASPTQLTATVPTGAGAGTVTVTTPGGTASSPSPFTVSHSRRVSLSLSRTRARGSVTAVDGFTKCSQQVAVRVQRRVSGSWRTVGSDITDGNGRYSVGNVRTAGRYRAVAVRQTLSSGDVCSRKASASARQSR
ncbi:MAG: IPT/TIG domain-containing protein [Solirubrobacteraceae bacterium]|nr:IPT/TIG domain-containing protein [Solirubrobacteraceae bacterium]